MKSVAHRHQIARLTAIPTSTTALPPELLETAARRVGYLGLALAVTAPLSYVAEYYLQPARVSAAGPFSLPGVAAIMLFAIGTAGLLAAWSRRVPSHLIIDLGLIFEVLGAFAISLSENASPLPPGAPVRGISWNCLWIAAHAAAVPATTGKVAVASLAAAAMSPVGFAVATVITQNAPPAVNQLVLLFLPNFMAAAWAIPAARHLHRLGAQVGKAREMGSYKLIEPIGTGGMGEVWRAEHRMLARPSAIKLIRPDAQDPEQALRRFEREARAIAGLRSPHTVSLYDFGIAEDGRFYYVMELLTGMDLEDLVARHGPQPPARAIYLLRQAARSLAEAHENGLVHRDIKPRNLYACHLGTEYDFVKVLDFGLVKAMRYGGETLTALSGGTIAGTPAYMAPEIVSGAAQIDGRADLYALGCVAYWLLTGATVYPVASGAVAAMLAHVQQDPAPPSTHTRVPEDLERVVLRCLAKDPADRPQTALELIGLLDACAAASGWDERRASEWWNRNFTIETRA
jgi:serine/threonine-protein kinase